MEKFSRFKSPKMKEVICFLSTLPLMRECSHSCCVVRNCQYMLSLDYFRNFVWILQERVSSLFFVGFIEVVEENNTSVVCGRNWYFFRVHYKTDYPSDNSGQPCLKEGPTKDSLFSVKSGQAYPPKIPFFKSWTRFSVSRMRFEFDTGRLVTGKTGIKEKNLSKQ